MLRGFAIAARFLALALAVMPVACGHSPTSPTPPPPPPPPPPTLGLTCPAAASGLSIRNQPVAVTWAAPTPVGGTAPVQTSCSPASGSSFSAGVTSVTCSASDGASQTASCSFTVTIARPPQLPVTRFMAFGDSITWGTASPPAPFRTAYPLPPPSHSYPTQLLGRLTGRYPDQTITMDNEGWPGEAVGDGLTRLPSAIAANNPDVLLLLDGANDLLGSPKSATTVYIASKLRDMVQAAKARKPGIRVMLATFPRQYHGSIPYDRGAGADFVPELNQRIADVAASEGATLVDLYAPFPSDLTSLKTYIGGDGLHPTEQGFTLIAETWAAAIQRTFEFQPLAPAGPAPPMLADPASRQWLRRVPPASNTETPGRIRLTDR